MIPELDTDLNRELPNEWTVVERPLLQQLIAMGWTYVEGDLDYPQKTFRDRFRDVLLKDKLRAAIRGINADENLDEVIIDRAIAALERFEKTGGLERNREITEKLIKGVSVPRASAGEGPFSRNVTVRFFDFNPANLHKNEFLAINQFRIDYIGDGIRTKIQVVDFWRDDQSRLSLEKSVYKVLLRSGKVARAKIAELATRIVELARHRHRWLIWNDGKNQDK